MKVIFVLNNYLKKTEREKQQLKRSIKGKRKEKHPC